MHQPRITENKKCEIVSSNAHPIALCSRKQPHPLVLANFDEKRLNYLLDSNCSNKCCLEQNQLLEIVQIKSTGAKTRLKATKVLCSVYPEWVKSTQNISTGLVLSLLMCLFSDGKSDKNLVQFALDCLSSIAVDAEILFKTLLLIIDSPFELKCEKFLVRFVRIAGKNLSPFAWNLAKDIFSKISHDNQLQIIHLLAENDLLLLVDPQILGQYLKSLETNTMRSLLRILIESNDLLPVSPLFETTFDCILDVINRIDDCDLTLDTLSTICSRLDSSLSTRNFMKIIQIYSLLPGSKIVVLSKKMLQVDAENICFNQIYSRFVELIETCSCLSSSVACHAVELYEMTKRNNDFPFFTPSKYCQNHDIILIHSLMSNFQYSGDKMTSILLHEPLYDFIVAFFECLKLYSDNMSRKDCMECVAIISSMIKSGKLGSSIKKSLKDKLKKDDIFTYAYSTLYKIYTTQRHWSRKFIEDCVLAFMCGLQKSGGTSTQFCIHALLLISYEYPNEICRLMPSIVIKLSQIMSHTQISIHVLEFLALISDIPQIYRNFVDEDYRRIFGISVLYIQSARYEVLDQDITKKSFMQYVLLMAYSLILIWFNKLKSNRKIFFDFLSRSLVIPTEEQSMLCVELLKTLTLTPCEPEFLENTYVFPDKVVSFGQQEEENTMKVICISAGGTFSSLIHSNSKQSLLDQLKAERDGMEYPKEIDMNNLLHVRAINVLKKTPNIDLHKIGVIYIAPLQFNEDDILANIGGSLTYCKFLGFLGFPVKLKNSPRFTGGLDKEQDLDGSHSISWTMAGFHVVFHVSTLMPTYKEDYKRRLYMKKRHIGNDFVTIAWDESGTDTYNIETIPSEFNFVSIVIIPGDMIFTVRIIKRDKVILGMAEEKVFYSLEALALYVRHTCVNMNMFSSILSNAERGQEFVSNTRDRSRQIKRLYDRVTASNF